MQRISYKDWIAGKRHLAGRHKRLQEDILSDDGFPDSLCRDEMLSYLKSHRASEKCLITFKSMYRQYEHTVLDVCDRRDPVRTKQCI